MAGYSDKAERVLQYHSSMKADKAVFMSTWQAAAHFVRGRRMNFTEEMTQGQMLTGQIYDSTATRCMHKASSAYQGQLFPTAEKSIRIDPPFKLRKIQSTPVKEFYAEISRRICKVFGYAKTGFTLSHQEHWGDLVFIGNSGMAIESTTGKDRYKVPVRFKSVDAKIACIAEGPDGRVDTIYIEKTLTVRQIVMEYGYDKVSQETKSKFDKGKVNEKVKVLHAIEPRLPNSPNAFGVKGKAFGSIHIEIKQKKILREAGFDYLPIVWQRFYKDKDELYGRSPTTEMLPEIITIDHYSELLTTGAELTAEPPVLAKQDAISGGVVDITPRAVMMTDDTMLMRDNGGKIVEPVFTVGDMNPVREEKEQIKQELADGYAVDRLLDLSNETSMTLGEANMRFQLRGQSLSDVFDRALTEFYTPVVEITAQIMKDKGLLGVRADDVAALIMKGFDEVDLLIIPDEVQKIIDEGEDWFEITFISPAARILQQETMIGIEKVSTYVAELAPVHPEVLDNVNFDEALKTVVYLSGAPSELIRSEDEVQEIRDKREQQQMAAMQLEAQKLQAETAKAGGAAIQSVGKAQESTNGRN